MESYQLFSASSIPTTASTETGGSKSSPVVKNTYDHESDDERFIGMLEVFIHQARDIQNICIYHKQDVYAKFCLTSDPDIAVSTKIINGGGRNPVFNENLLLNVRTIESSLKCEVWMLSRVKNYLEDQLLGFSLVPLSDVLTAKGSFAQEFSLSSTDLFHSPAGFVHLSLSYAGASPEVMAIRSVPKTVISDSTLPDAEADSMNTEYESYDKIEFPDLKAANENQQMVSEYFGLHSADMETQSSESLVNSESGNCLDEEAGVHLVESFSSAHSIGGSLDSNGAQKNDTFVCSASSSSTTTTTISHSVSDTMSAAASPIAEDRIPNVTQSEADSSDQSNDTFVKPIISVNIEPQQTVVQQDIVDMYTKSMQEFTDSLAKMKLPMDIKTNIPVADNGTPESEKELPTPKGMSSRVFYGSRAFF